MYSSVPTISFVPLEIRHYRCSRVANSLPCNHGGSSFLLASLFVAREAVVAPAPQVGGNGKKDQQKKKPPSFLDYKKQEKGNQTIKGEQQEEQNSMKNKNKQHEQERKRKEEERKRKEEERKRKEEERKRKQKLEQVIADILKAEKSVTSSEKENRMAYLRKIGNKEDGMEQLRKILVAGLCAKFNSRAQKWRVYGLKSGGYTSNKNGQAWFTATELNEKDAIFTNQSGKQFRFVLPPNDNGRTNKLSPEDVKDS